MSRPYFIIEGNHYKEFCFPALNQYLAEVGRHPKAGNQIKQRYGYIATVYIRQYLKTWKTDKPIKLHYTFGEPNKGKRRDYDNIVGVAMKFIHDAMQQTGTIPNDNPTYIKGFDFEFVYVDEPFIRVEIEEL